MSSGTEAQVVGLRVCIGHKEPMNVVQTVKMIEDYGIEGDRHAGRGGQENSRQVLLMDRETLDEFDLSDGEVRENVTTSGIDITKLEQGQRLSVGDVELEITEDCAPCSRIEEIRPGLQEQLEGRRGVLARVLQTGSVSVGDGIGVLAKAAK